MIQLVNDWIKFYNVLFNDSLSWKHSKKVGELVRELCRKLKYPKTLAKKMVIAAIFSDIGIIYQLLEKDGTHPSTLGDDSYYLFLRMIPDHETAELIRHVHCFKPGYYPGRDEPFRGYPEVTCSLLMHFPECLQVLQIAHEFESKKFFTDDDPYHHIEFLVANDRWDLEIWDKVKNFLP